MRDLYSPRRLQKQLGGVADCVLHLHVDLILQPLQELDAVLAKGFKGQLSRPLLVVQTLGWVSSFEGEE